MIAEEENELIADLTEELRLAQQDVEYFMRIADNAEKSRQTVIDGYESHLALLNRALSQAEGSAVGLGVVTALEFFVIIYLMAI